MLVRRADGTVSWEEEEDGWECKHGEVRLLMVLNERSRILDDVVFNGEQVVAGIIGMMGGVLVITPAAEV